MVMLRAYVSPGAAHRPSRRRKYKATGGTGYGRGGPAPVHMAVVVRRVMAILARAILAKKKW